MKKTYIFKQVVWITFCSILWSCSNSNKIKNNEAVSSQEKTVLKKPFFKLSLAQWSLHKQIYSGELNPIDFAKKAKELSFEGVEYVSMLYIDHLKKNIDSVHAFQNLLDTLKAKSEKHNIRNVLIMVDREGDLAELDSVKRNQTVKNHKKWVDAAAFLGCHAIRVNAKGEGTPEEVANAAVDGLGKLADYAQSKNINILVENHGGYSSDAKWLSTVMKKINKKNCGTLPDFGNFCKSKITASINREECTDAFNIYDGVRNLMPFAKSVSAKSYDFDEQGNVIKIDYNKMLQIVKDAGYTGFIGVEYEGNNLEEDAGIIATRKLLLKVNQQLQ